MHNLDKLALLLALLALVSVIFIEPLKLAAIVSGVLLGTGWVIVVGRHIWRKRND